jgi:hypothetical protein
VTDDDRLTDPATDPALLLGIRPPDPTTPHFVREAEIVARFRAGLFADGLDWRVGETGPGMETWQSPATPHCWICFMYQGGRLADIQASFPQPDSAWGQRLAAVVVRVVCDFQLSAHG